jgi:hypothetical protein
MGHEVNGLLRTGVPPSKASFCDIVERLSSVSAAINSQAPVASVAGIVSGFAPRR